LFNAFWRKRHVGHVPVRGGASDHVSPPALMRADTATGCSA
jgi:hypothetical protein